jgi:hypothetical protein
MQWNRKRVLVAAVWLVSLLAAHYVGGVIGFSQGYSTARGLSGHDAFISTTILRLLRQERTKDAIDFLEVKLDDQIAAASAFGDAPRTYRSPYNLWLRFAVLDAPVEENAAAFSQVLRYRQEFPPAVPGAEAKAKIMSALEPYRNAPQKKE